MTLLPKLELALRAYLLDQFASESQLIRAGGGYLVTAGGLRFTVRNGGVELPDLEVQFYVGETTEVANLPAVHCVALTCREDFGTGHFFADAAVLVKYPGDSSDARPDVVAIMLETSEAICRLLLSSDPDELAEALNGYVENFTAVGLVERQGARLVEERTRIHRYSLQIYCTEADLVGA